MFRFTRSAAYATGLLVLCISGTASALNYFELETYPYKTASQGEVEVENATTYTSRGTKEAPTPDNNTGLTRSTFELVYGVTDKTEVAYYRDYARTRGADHFDHVASRYRARTRFYEKGELPADLGLYVEFETPRGEEADLEGELRGIIEVDFGRWTFDFNPIFERVLRGTEESKEEGWELQYAMALVFRGHEKWQPRIDLFGDFGPIKDFEPRDEQKHLIMPAIDVKLGRGLFATVGVGFGLTEATEQRLIRGRLEWEF